MNPAGAYQEDLFLPPPVRAVMANRDKFTQDFIEWIPTNIHIYEAFARETKKIIARGFQHYSSRTIIEFLRHHSAVKEAGGGWKINNNIQPYLPRLFDLMNPQHVGMWEYRETKKVEREKTQR